MRFGKTFGVTAGASLLFIGVGTGTANASDSAIIENQHSGLCIGVGSQRGNGAPAIQWGCVPGGVTPSDMKWSRWGGSASDGTAVTILNNHYSDKCLGVGSSLANGAGVIQWDCNNASDEKWWFEDGELRNVYSGKCLGTGSSQSTGTQLIQWDCNGASDERWRMYSV
ncbi:RICIN domain-containing protein [Streptomyces violascens]|uniref:RICIN domain-containing protein n=1 Tax=Streptomyces violascens TaxID=67381 RepID=UPI0036CFFBF6